MLKLLQAVSSALSILSAPSLAAEPALAVTHTDKQLVWGACPDFIPKGCEIAVLHGDPAKGMQTSSSRRRRTSPSPGTGIPRQSEWCWSRESCP